MLSLTFVALLFSLLINYNSSEKCKDMNGSMGYCYEKDNCSRVISSDSCLSNEVCCIISEKSEKKCLEYGKYVYTEGSAVANLPRMENSRVSQCHIGTISLVIGGEKAHEMEFPHMVAIGYGKNLETAEWMCGGSLISEKFVLTAAHCSKSKNKGPAIFARLGILDLKNTNDKSHIQDFIIVERIIHPKYLPPSRYHDIALFKLSGSVKMDAFSRPACLHTIPNDELIKKAIATGWGKLDYNDEKGSDHLMKVTIDIINPQECNLTFAADIGGKIMHDGITEHQLCAGDLQGGKDTCHGDSGGPLQIVADDPYCMYKIIGVTSFGKFCGFKNSPAVYTKVSYYIQWIESLVW